MFTRRHMAKVNVVTWLVDGERRQQWFYARQQARTWAAQVGGAIHEEWMALAQEA